MQTSATTGPQRVVNAPHVTFDLVPNPQTEDYYLVLACSKCGDVSKKPCAGVAQRIAPRVVRYGLEHLHAS